MSYKPTPGGESPARAGRIYLLLSDDLRRSRFTVFFRLLLCLPHLVWLSAWSMLVVIAAVLNWLCTLILGAPPRLLHRFLAAYVRYVVHLGAYMFLAGNPFPGFTGAPGYPVDAQIPSPGRQNRFSVLFRALLAVPAVLIAVLLSVSGASSYGTSYALGLLGAAAFLGWWAALVMGRMPRGLRDAIAYSLSYAAQLNAYLLLLTDRYPSSDPLTAIGQPPPRSLPISLEVSDSLRRNRLTVFFRLLLSLPHVLWLTLWSLLAGLAAVLSWVATLLMGRSPRPLHNFLAAFLRYQTSVYAYLCLIGNPFPGFTGKQGTYPISLSVAGPARQNRMKTLLRLPLALPALLVGGAYGNLLYLIAFLAWFSSLLRGRIPLGLRNAGALCLRYGAQLGGYLLLLTDTYPYAGPIAPERPDPITIDSGPPSPASALAHATPQ